MRWLRARAARRCAERGHKWGDLGIPCPYVFCRRWGCDKSAVSRWARPDHAAAMHNAIPPENRFPPVTIHPDGSFTVLPGHEHEEPRPL